MSIIDLRHILAPPHETTERPSEAEWAECEAELTKLPPDYKSFLEDYGTGCIDGFIWIFNPSSQNPNLNLLVQVKRQLSALDELIKQKTEDKIYPLYPEKSGLLPFGITDNGDVLFWKTIGTPENWSVVVGNSRSPEYQEFQSSMTGFIGSVLNGATKVATFPEDFPKSSPSFKPYRHSR
jgi:hypothetical protein